MSKTNSIVPRMLTLVLALNYFLRKNWNCTWRRETLRSRASFFLSLLCFLRCFCKVFPSLRHFVTCCAPSFCFWPTSSFVFSSPEVPPALPPNEQGAQMACYRNPSFQATCSFATRFPPSYLSVWASQQLIFSLRTSKTTRRQKDKKDKSSFAEVH